MSDNDRPVKAVVSCGAPHLVTHVVIHEQTWGHVETEHADAFTYDQVIKAIEEPTEALESKQSHTKPTLVLTNSAIKSANSGTPLLVFVRVYEDNTGILRTAYNSDPERIGRSIWKKSDSDA